MKKIIIAIDGFSGCGKSTMAKDLAKTLNYIFIDTGAMYRAVTLYSLNNNLFGNDILDEKKLQEQINNIKIEFRLNPETGRPDTYLNGENVQYAIRQPEVDAKVSTISAVKFVREAMVRQQQEMGKNKGIIMDGRDIGTVVFPDAELKIFVTADPEVRAQRRLLDYRRSGNETITFEEVLKELKERDYKDQTRNESPLRKAGDAIELDNTHLTIDEQRQWLMGEYNKVISNEK
jgi:cytidylate kinase